MAVAVNCRCGRTYQLKDEFAGRLVQCPHCAAATRAPGQPQPPPRGQAEAIFDRDKFLLHERMLAVSDQYTVWDETGAPVLYVERPAHLGRALLAIAGGLAAGLTFGIGLGLLAALVPNPAVQTALICVAIAGSVVVIYAVSVVLYTKRHVNFYRDETGQEVLLRVLEDRKLQPIIVTYTIVGPSGQVLAGLRKNGACDVIRKRWQCFAPDGSLLCTAMEDSIILSLLRRTIGSLFGVLRANFVLVDARTEKVLGEFNRNFTILDRYVLDLKADPGRTLDRRIALAIGVMLDTG